MDSGHRLTHADKYPINLSPAHSSDATPASAASDKPQIFAPGVISGAAHETAPAFTPDGRTVYFGRGSDAAAFILVSHLAKSKWSEPVIAAFSGRWLDMEPAMAPDGTYLIFVSNRPISPDGPPIDGAINGESLPRKGANLWRVNRTHDGWSDPARLPNNISSSHSTYSPSVASNGDLYFMRPDGEKSQFRIFKAKRTAEGYENPLPGSFSDGQFTDVDPAVAPDLDAIPRRTSIYLSLFDEARIGASPSIWETRSTVLSRMRSRALALIAIRCIFE